MKIQGDTMGMIKKGLLYTGLFALGLAVGYKACNSPDYRVVEDNGRICIESRNAPKPKQDAEKKTRDITDRIKDAYESLTK
ncbi:hypothetical protein KY363_01730 [Candidatus Woesearchaeota archaeon]|nr:hypothetical protein [Candidatus Woesearchaeota archaeon]